jgi:hypothetical protein
MGAREAEDPRSEAEERMAAVMAAVMGMVGDAGQGQPACHALVELAYIWGSLEAGAAEEELGEEAGSYSRASLLDWTMALRYLSHGAKAMRSSDKLRRFFDGILSPADSSLVATRGFDRAVAREVSWGGVRHQRLLALDAVSSWAGSWVWASHRPEAYGAALRHFHRSVSSMRSGALRSLAPRERAVAARVLERAQGLERGRWRRDGRFWVRAE